jgi:magnesium transporter
MITILTSTENGLQTLPDFSPGCWVNMVDPDPDELARVSEGLKIPSELLTPALDLDESPRSETDNGFLLIVMRVPLFEGEESSTPYTTVPLGIVLGEQHVVTVTKQDNGTIRDLLEGRVRNLNTARKNSFFLLVFLTAAKRFLSHLREIDRKVEEVEDRLEVALHNKEVLELLKYQKCLTFFTTALKADELMIKHLERSHNSHLAPEESEALDDALTEFGQAITMTDISSGILTQMMDAFASIISNNLNVVMKFLASVTIILALPTLVASIYGMNILLPFQSHPMAFLLTMGGSLVISVIVILVFRRRGWL